MTVTDPRKARSVGRRQVSVDRDVKR